MIESTLFESHFDLIPFAIYAVDVATHEIIFSNKQFRELFGDHRGTSCHRALYDLDRPCAFCRIPDLVTRDGQPNGRTLVFEHFNDAADCWFQLQERAMAWPDGRVVKYSIAVDISELKKTQNQLAEAHAQLALKNKDLARLAVTDPLTGLCNRLRLDKVLADEAARLERHGRIFSVIIADIDHFKRINDEHGHAAGDAALRDLARVLARSVRATDTVGRFGGEEFLVICPETDLAGAGRLAEVLRCRVAEVTHAAGGRLTMSFGAAQARSGEDPSKVVGRADAALYLAKAEGRDRVRLADVPAD
ncbi:sensor domain-containing diguanylate cyclase [Desulfolutivibrio sulfoxidireducens]|uniref:sensor domain-containing diguanylate cyclase n=1 Tax=Desulfolutivibrio sulfoxidireducens TaxID=2773299 RepID=UPI00159D6614|nr:sensor domain-containing diguanylate cyclase [Desulfolutivibrio sulfoxidireducens]QLA18565.1 diguanylate cyclase [Desulfolutivibrio sulfoxidireducens]